MILNEIGVGGKKKNREEKWRLFNLKLKSMYSEKEEKQQKICLRRPPKSHLQGAGHGGVIDTHDNPDFHM